MRCLLFIFLFFLCSGAVLGQTESDVEKGAVSYVTSQNVYVRFESTENIAIGDTLYLSKDGRLVPVLLVNNKSSISCVCTLIASEKLNVSDVVFTRITIVAEEEPVVEEQTEEKTEEAPGAKPEVPVQGKAAVPGAEEEGFTQRIQGRVSVGSYSNFSGSRTSHRMRYTFALQGDNLGNSGFSVESYVVFRHTIGEWDEVRTNFGNALKVYSLAARYDFNRTMNVSLGRKINPRISSMGAIDGLQFEKGLGNFFIGGLAGSRPDFMNYGVNFHLFQAGAYVGHSSTHKKSYFQSTLAIVEQRNTGKTDRRFLYFQHSSSPVQNLSLFGSLELDLYQNIDDRPVTTLSLTNLYLLLRYRFSRKLSTTVSYDNRKNVIYYESYKNYIDSLIDDETRQGLRFNINYHPFNFVTLGVNASGRFQKDNSNLSRNLNVYLTFSSIPQLKVSATFTGNFLQTNYLDSKMVGVRIARDFMSGKLGGDLYFRMADFKYKNFEYNTRQSILGINFGVRVTRKLGIYLYYEAIFNDRKEMYNRINTRIIQRF